MTGPSQPRLFSALLLTAVALMLTVLACVLWSSAYERPYLSYRNLPFPAAHAVEAGNPVELHVVRCNNSRRKQTYLTTHELRDLRSGQVALLPEVMVSLAPGCTESTSRVNVIPRGTAPGRYMVSGIALVEGVVSDHRVAWESQPFDVLPGSPAEEK